MGRPFVPSLAIVIRRSLARPTLKAFVRFDPYAGLVVRTVVAWRTLHTDMSGVGHEQQISDGRSDVGFSRKRPSAAAWHPAALGPGCVRRALHRCQSYRDIGFAITDRQLAVILHRMWIDGTEFNWSTKKAAAEHA